MMTRSALFGFLLASAASAPASVLYSTTFEEFADGPIPGQFGWSSNTSLPHYEIGTWGEAGKGLRFDSRLLIGSGVNMRYADRALAHVPTAAEPIFLASVRISGGTFSSGTGGTSFYGLSLLDAAGEEKMTGLLNFVGGSVLAGSTFSFAGTSGNFGAALLPTGSWHELTLKLDTAVNQASILLNGGLVYTEAYSWDDSLITRLRISTSAAGKDTGFFDNLRVETVPEPASVVVLGLGLTAIRRRRKG